MKGQWVSIGPTGKPYCEVVVDDSGLVYISVVSGGVRTSDYLDAEDAERVGLAIVAAARLVLAKRHQPGTAKEASDG